MEMELLLCKCNRMFNHEYITEIKFYFCVVGGNDVGLVSLNSLRAFAHAIPMSTNA